MRKQCENCTTEFEPKQDHQRFCSGNCRTENHYRKKFGIKEPFKASFTEQLTERVTDDKNGLKTAKNADIGIFERLMDEREARISDKIALARAEMEIQMLKRELEDAKGFAAVARELAPALTQLLNNNNR
jgi:hypothetical protein